MSGERAMGDEHSLWWVRYETSEPVGPVEQQLVLRGIQAGKVPRAAQVCRIGSNDWAPLVVVEPFAAAARALGPPSVPAWATESDGPAADGIPPARPAEQSIPPPPARPAEQSIPPPPPVPALTEAEERALSSPGALSAVALPSTDSADDAPLIEVELDSESEADAADADVSDECETTPAPGAPPRPAFMALTSEFFRAGDELGATPRPSGEESRSAPDSARTTGLDHEASRRRSPALATVGIVLLLCALAAVVALLRQ